MEAAAAGGWGQVSCGAISHTSSSSLVPLELEPHPVPPLLQCRPELPFSVCLPGSRQDLHEAVGPAGSQQEPRWRREESVSSAQLGDGGGAGSGLGSGSTGLGLSVWCGMGWGLQVVTLQESCPCRLAAATSTGGRAQGCAGPQLGMRRGLWTQRWFLLELPCSPNPSRARAVGPKSARLALPQLGATFSKPLVLLRALGEFCGRTSLLPHFCCSLVELLFAATAAQLGGLEALVMAAEQGSPGAGSKTMCEINT